MGGFSPALPPSLSQNMPTFVRFTRGISCKRLFCFLKRKTKRQTNEKDKEIGLVELESFQRIVEGRAGWLKRDVSPGCGRRREASDVSLAQRPRSRPRRPGGAPAYPGITPLMTRTPLQFVGEEQSFQKMVPEPLDIHPPGKHVNLERSLTPYQKKNSF